MYFINYSFLFNAIIVCALDTMCKRGYFSRWHDDDDDDEETWLSSSSNQKSHNNWREKLPMSSRENSHLTPSELATTKSNNNNNNYRWDASKSNKTEFDHDDKYIYILKLLFFKYKLKC